MNFRSSSRPASRLAFWLASFALVAGLHMLLWHYLNTSSAPPPVVPADVKAAVAVDMMPPPPPAVPPPPVPQAAPPPPLPIAPPAPAVADSLPPPPPPRPVTPHKRSHVIPPQHTSAIRAVAPPQPVSTTAPAPPAPAAPPAPPSASASEVANWQGRLRAQLLRFRSYPAAAEARGQQGTVLMRVTLGPQGQILALALVQSSGFADLDADAATWLHRAAPLPPPPGGIQVTAIVPLRYHLDDDD